MYQKINIFHLLLHLMTEFLDQVSFNLFLYPI